jgi:hypothetical protein
MAFQVFKQKIVQYKSFLKSKIKLKSPPLPTSLFSPVTYKNIEASLNLACF